MAKRKRVPAGHSWDSGCRCPDCKHAHYAALGKSGGLKNKARHGKSYFSKLAKTSHPVNNPAAKRKEYIGGRPVGRKNTRKDADVANGPGTQ